MQKLRLKKPVTLTGTDVWGRNKNAWIRFEPISEPGWFWKTCRGDLIPIDVSLARYSRWGYISLQFLDQWLHIWEHIGVLRWTGLDGVAVSGSPFPPYHGRPLELWYALHQAAEVTEGEVPWCSITSRFEWRYNPTRDGVTVIAEPQAEATVLGKVCIDYPGLGKEQLPISLSADQGEKNREFLDLVFRANTQGWPKWRYPVCWLASKIWWPHLDKVTWPHYPNALKGFVYHRVGDLLGALSLVSHLTLPACTIFSVKSGHQADLEVLRKLQAAKRNALVGA